MEKFAILSDQEKKFILRKCHLKDNKNYQYVLKHRIKKKIDKFLRSMEDIIFEEECSQWFKIQVAGSIEYSYNLIKMKYPELFD